MADASALTELKNAHVKTIAEDEVDSSISNIEHESCCSRVANCLDNIIPITAITHFISTLLTNSYDLLTILISIADVTTDIWVIYNFKKDNKIVFFILSLIFICLAQLSYAMAFVIRFRPKYHYNPMNPYSNEHTIRTIKMFFFILPLTPVISFIFYWATVNPQNCFIKLIDKLFEIDDEMKYMTSKNQAPIITWIEKKLQKHLGFVLEALIEALPQSIIQLIAIVYYGDNELVNIISICISLLSVATKTMVFSVAIDFRVFIYNWLSLMCDFFGIFAIISWVFYNPDNPGQITFIGEIWLHKAVIMWILSCLLIGLPMIILWFQDTVSCSRSEIKKHGFCHEFLFSLPYIFIFMIVYAIGCAFAIAICEIIFFAPFAFFFFIIAHERYVGSETSILAKITFDFILDNKPMYRKLFEKSKTNNNNNNNNSKMNEIENTQLSKSAIENNKIMKLENDNKAILSQIGQKGKNKLLNEKERMFRLALINYCHIKHYRYSKNNKLINFLETKLATNNNDDNNNNNNNNGKNIEEWNNLTRLSKPCVI